ncbi:uncharacterized protein LOC142343049 [Convolutriloba macropyga]|uniref:uncharacterized protein LOC142343049 n=1 Tax=Convolutriloba macropyga TaxID=536237 RepID=UPI003F52887A
MSWFAKRGSITDKAYIDDLVAELTADQISELKVAFDAFDTDHSGSIDAEELGKAMQSMGKHMNSKDLRDLINNVDEDDLENTDEYDEVFFRLIFMKMGEEISDEEIENILAQADRDGDGKIGWDDFHYVMLNSSV